MIDMGVNWIKLSTGEILVDLRGDTVAPGKMLDGTTAHDASGAPIEGNIPSVNGGTFQPTTAEQTIIEGGSYVKNDVKIAAATAGEDVTEEVNVYTAKLSELGTAITALEQELEGKSAVGGAVETCDVLIRRQQSSLATLTYTDSDLQLKTEEIGLTQSAGYNVIVAKNTIMNCSYTFHLTSNTGESYLTNDGYSVVILDDCEVTAGV